ncbi:hypothetical protein HJG60_009596 [Phyllostomus discolor]|uniref:Uncharacterized protein n=1 Tax=Phyllostomus discolor TaxID=89673 RepID=A0A833YFS5_9CHIR|nr:hypothetical protein HJG60_009596 [Phyllostomus discolor]
MSFSVESDDCCEWDIFTHLLSVFTFPGHGSLSRTIPQRMRLMSPLGPGSSLLTWKPREGRPTVTRVSPVGGQQSGDRGGGGFSPGETWFETFSRRGRGLTGTRPALVLRAPKAQFALKARAPVSSSALCLREFNYRLGKKEGRKVSLKADTLKLC